jgi:hypothetical protein
MTRSVTARFLFSDRPPRSDRSSETSHLPLIALSCSLAMVEAHGGRQEGWARPGDPTFGSDRVIALPTPSAVRRKLAAGRVF